MKSKIMRNSLGFKVKRQFIQAKRRLFNWRGDGVHSPYAYRVIRDVIRNPHPFSSFSRLYRSEQAQALRKQYKDSYCTNRRQLELLFRFVHSHKPQSIYLEHTEESLIPRYLEATGYYTKSTDIASAEMIIIEDVYPKVEELIHRASLASPLYIVLNNQNPKVRTWAKQYRKQIAPPIVFDTFPLQVWVWRKATTPGFYAVYY